MEPSFVSAIVVLLLVMDPVGNIPLFVALLSRVEPRRRIRVIVRECAIAFAVLFACILAGNRFLALFGLSDISLEIAGGVILFLIALRMVFRHPEGIFGAEAEGEPFIVPLAIPAIAGPAALATVMLFVAREPQHMLEWTAALAIATAITLALLVFAERIAVLVGQRFLIAFERLMGLVLTAIAIEMLLRGVERFVRQF
ncbi:MAG TPA: MarC family protein [Burkholderiales bacterium]|nr:MarC family protein [Burkholderiales bacterium]